MNRNKLKTYAPEARRDFIEAVTARAAQYGLTAKKIEPMTVEGDVAMIAGKPYPKAVGEKRKKLDARINRDGFGQTMEAMAYTWFNRLVAIRFMELHEYLDHGYRVLSHPQGHSLPEIVEHAEHVDLPGLDKKKVIELKLDGTKEEELYRMLLIGQCNALSKAMPFLFESIDDETELLLPDHLLHSDSLIRNLVNEIPEEDWQEVEIIGWLYQFYISEKKDEVIGKVVKSEDIPAATQLFTPNWIVKYLVQNSLGRQWMATYPDSPLKEQMQYYIEPAEQSPEVQAKLGEITPDVLNPEELTLLDPACGSGHILVEAYNLLKAIYQERGYRAKDISRFILEKNLYGLEIDDRAAQLAALALMMKARADDRNIFERDVQPQVLSIQESKRLNAAEITEALNAPLPDGSAGDISQADVAHLIELFEEGKTFGALIQVPKVLVEKLPNIARRVESVRASGGMLERTDAQSFQPIIEQAGCMARQYDAVVMNPPYMGRRNGMNDLLRDFVISKYPDARPDLYSAFVEQALLFARPQGRVAMITMQSWMFLSSFQNLRQHVLGESTIESMAHLGPRAFSTISGEVVQTTSFCLLAQQVEKYRPTFFRLVSGEEATKSQHLRERTNSYSHRMQSDFHSIPGSPIAYWASDAVVSVFQECCQLSEIAKPRQGLATGDNARFLRMWHEVSFAQIKLDAATREEAWESGAKWFPLTKGGEYRKWFGNNEIIISFDRPNYEVLKTMGNHCPSEQYYFREGITWSTIASKLSMRFAKAGAVFETKGAMCFASDHETLLYLLAFANSCLVENFMLFISPTLDFHEGPFGTLPVRISQKSEIAAIASECIESAEQDWNSNETSWDFSTLPLLNVSGDACIRDAWSEFHSTSMSRIEQMKEREELINRRFIEVYDLEHELTSEVDDSDITLYRPERQEDTERLISYAIGCMMGRYSLDEPGLIYAQNGNDEFDPSKYSTFPADEDGIVPLTEFQWFEDDAASRFEKFIATAWPKEHLQDNLEFVAESLGQKRGESPRDTIRRYLVADFFKHHLSLYKKRPIYWLFSSGKKRGFQALVYLHRYSNGTLARMRTEYVIPLLGKMTARIEQLTDDIPAASSSQHQKRLEKEKDTVVKQLAEVQAFDEKLRHYADQRISLDLDEGVKENYGKFGSLLAEVKKVTGKNPKD